MKRLVVFLVAVLLLIGCGRVKEGVEDERAMAIAPLVPTTTPKVIPPTELLPTATMAPTPNPTPMEVDINHLHAINMAERALFVGAEDMGYQTTALKQDSGRYLVFEADFGLEGGPVCFVLNGTEWDAQATEISLPIEDVMLERYLSDVFDYQFFISERNTREYYDPASGEYSLIDTEVSLLLEIMRVYKEEAERGGNPSFSAIAGRLFNYRNPRIDVGLRSFAKRYGYDLHLNFSFFVGSWVFELNDYDPISVGKMTSVYIIEYNDTEGLFSSRYDGDEDLYFDFDAERIIEKFTLERQK